MSTPPTLEGLAASIDVVLAELAALRIKVDGLGGNLPLVLTRAEAAKELKVSVRQLQRLVRAGRLMAHPSGIARTELERYAKTPQTKVTEAMTRKRHLSPKEEAERGREMLRELARRTRHLR